MAIDIVCMGMAITKETFSPIEDASFYIRRKEGLKWPSGQAFHVRTIEHLPVYSKNMLVKSVGP